MSNHNARDPAPWAPHERGAFIIELGAGGDLVALHTFIRRHGTDPSRKDSWSIFEVCNLRRVDSLAPSGWIEGDGGFNFWPPAELDAASKTALVACVEEADPRLHLNEDDLECVFE